MTKPPPIDHVQLPLGAKADPDTCGSCVSFWRLDDYNLDKVGRCCFKLPPQYALKDWDGDSRPRDTVNDTHRCDLYRRSPKTFIVSKLSEP